MVLQQTVEALLAFISLVAVICLGQMLWRHLTRVEECSSPNSSNQPHQQGKLPPTSEPRVSPQQGSQAHGSGSEDIALSMAVSAATDSVVIGYAVGGSLLGSIAGAAVSDACSYSIEQIDNDTPDPGSSEPDSSNNFD